MKFYLFIVLGLVLISGCTQSGGDNMKNQSVNRFANFETSVGNFKVELFDDKAPLTARNFVQLVQQGFYDGTKFHRVIKNFMIQGGDPLSKNDSQSNMWGTGGPGYTIPDEFGEGLKHDSVGMLSMANAGPNTGGSQFFITVAPTPWLDGKHAIFGKVVQGYDIVEKISKVKTVPGDKPMQPITINKIRISDK